MLVARAAAMRPETGDAWLYAAAALFGLLTLAVSTIALYRQWAAMAIGPYAAAAVASLVIGRVRASRRARGARGSRSPLPGSPPRPQGRRPWPKLGARSWVLVAVLVGATVVPLSFEVAWRHDGNAAAHVQPEAMVVEQAGDRAASGHDPYRTVVGPGGKVLDTTPGQPAYESFFPYLPLMIVFGLPSSTRDPTLSDARIFFSIATLLATAGALALSRGSREPKLRILQFLTVLPTAALPLATGGDDMPIVALLLLAMVLAQRRLPGWSGLVLGVASAMKFTAWPLAALALFAARTREGRRAPVRMAAGMVAVGGAVVVPFVLRGPEAFLQNVILFPLGLSGVPSPAASPLPGHLLVAAFPALHRVVPLVAVLVGGGLLVRHLWRHPPSTAARVCVVVAWVMLGAAMVAPATRVGYLLYPINFAVWGWALREPGEVVAGPVVRAFSTIAPGATLPGPAGGRPEERAPWLTAGRGPAAAGSRTA